MPTFRRTIGIDYSGARTPTTSLNGLRVYMTTDGSAPVEVPPPPTLKLYWTREGLAEWLIARLSEDIPTIVGIDHAFSFPLKYFEKHKLPRNWPIFLDDFQLHWPTDSPNVWVDFVRDAIAGNGRARGGNTKWRRLTEERAGGAKSVFHFDVPGSVAKSTHAGLPWLRHLRNTLGSRVHVWPFDGWRVPDGRHVIAEVYPSMWSSAFPTEGLTPDQHDAYVVAAWLAQANADGTLDAALALELTDLDRRTASVEGWILGVPAGGRERPPRRPRTPGTRRPRKTTFANALDLMLSLPPNERLMVGEMLVEHAKMDLQPAAATTTAVPAATGPALTVEPPSPAPTGPALPSGLRLLR